MRRSTAVMVGLAALAVAQSIVIAKLWLMSRQEMSPPKAAAASKPSRLEAIPGSPVKRITLTEKGAERAGIETEAVGESVINHSLVVPGEVSQIERAETGGSTLVSSESLGLGDSQDKHSLVVRVPYSGDVDKLDRTKPARVMHLSRDELTLNAVPIEPAHGRYGRSRSSKVLTYLVDPAGENSTIHSGARVRVEIPQLGSGESRKVAPYSAVIYDANGTAWVYVNPEPLIFQREKVDVDFIRGNLAVLKSGPATGTPIVSVGATLLWGVELGK